MKQTQLTRPDGQIFRASPTRMQDAETCMLRFKFLYLDGIEEEEIEPSKYLTFGTTMHSVLELAHASNNAPTRKDLFRFLDESWLTHSTRLYSLRNDIPLWKALGYDNEKEEQEYLAEGKSMLDDYFVAQIQDGYKRAWEIEKYHQLPLYNDYVISVKIDKIDLLDDGRYRIIDYKTSKRKEKPEELDEDLQIMVYAWAVHQLYDIEYSQIESCGKYFLRHNEYVSTSVPIDQFVVGAAMDRIISKIKQAESNDFPHTTGWWCKYCKAKQVCPVVPPWAS